MVVLGACRERGCRLDFLLGEAGHGNRALEGSLPWTFEGSAALEAAEYTGDECLDDEVQGKKVRS